MENWCHGHFCPLDVDRRALACFLFRVTAELFKKRAGEKAALCPHVYTARHAASATGCVEELWVNHLRFWKALHK